MSPVQLESSEEGFSDIKGVFQERRSAGGWQSPHSSSLGHCEPQPLLPTRLGACPAPQPVPHEWQRWASSMAQAGLPILVKSPEDAAPNTPVTPLLRT